MLCFPLLYLRSVAVSLLHIASGTQALKIALVKEVLADWKGDDVVNTLGRGNLAIASALFTERMLFPPSS